MNGLLGLPDGPADKVKPSRVGFPGERVQASPLPEKAALSLGPLLPPFSQRDTLRVQVGQRQTGLNDLNVQCSAGESCRRGHSEWRLQGAHCVAFLLLLLTKLLKKMSTWD